MKTIKVISKKERAEKHQKKLAKKTAAKIKELPGEAEIREKAMEIYNQRIERGEYGNAETDWLEAERFLLDE
jgi:hypothetical protein